MRFAAFVVLVLSLVGCKTDSGSTLRDSAVVDAGPQITLLDLKTKTLTEWQELFASGEATGQMIPSSDKNGELLRGAGYPKIFNTLPQLNLVANKIWNGKNFVTNDGVTTLKNQFVQDSGTSVVQLFDAKVVVQEQSVLGDGKPVILLDYRISGVPGIKAIRDEVRLVSTTMSMSDEGVAHRRRLYLGPTTLLPDELSPLLSAWAKPWETNPILWFALEFNDTMVAP